MLMVLYDELNNNSDLIALLISKEIRKTIDEAIELSNDTIYGLWGYVFITDKNQYETISRKIKTGEVTCNNLVYSEPYNPFGNTKRLELGRTRGK